MKFRPYLRMFAWIAIAIAISVSSYHLLYPDFARREVASADWGKPASIRETPAAQALRKPSAPATRAADRPEPAKQIADRLARLHQQRDEFKARLRANPDDPALHAELQQLAAEEEQLTAAKAKQLEVPLVTIDGARLSHFEGDDPIYVRDFNANASISTAATQIRSTSPYNVTGSGVKIGIWEVGGLPRDTHDDLTGRVTLGDSGSSSYHATHVAGTLAGDGTTSSSVLGMAPASTLTAYDITSYADHSSEMSAAAATGEGSSTKIYLSNQSYGAASGWSYDSSTGKYSWYGTFSDDGNASNDEVKNYGRYATEARELDELVVDYPYLTMFFSAGNDRGYGTPSNGGTWYLNGSTAYTYDSSTHPKDNEDWMVDGSVTGFGTVSPQSSAKNVVCVGAVNDAVSSGSRSTGAASMSDFSAYGPTDDGRIKPDLVANGVSVTSLTNTSDSATATYNGTSMSCPNAAGTAALLVDYFDNKFSGQSMRASMLKALLIHTADDLGNAGPDFRYGWGLIDAKAAADVIKDTASDTTKARFLDGKLTTTDTSDTFTFDYDGSGELRVTLAWTDPEGSSINDHDDHTARLIHDLNLKVTGPNGTHYPYVMPWTGDWSDSKLNDAATTGVNSVDNVEQVYVSAPTAGTYTITVDYAGSLTTGQIYSLILTGGDFASEVPDGGSNSSYTKVSGFGSFEPFNVYDRFSSAHETTYSISVTDPSVVTAVIDGSGNVVITEVGTGTTTVNVTATNDLGGSDTVQLTVTVKANVIYVDASHTSGTKNGSSWSTAYDKLYDAISAASSGQEIWVADGVYFPTTTSSSPTAGSRSKTLTLPGGVAIYGGFSGNETSLDDRDPDTYRSILSGDLDQNDANRSDKITDKASELAGSNSAIVVMATDASDNFVLDGFTITAGQTANGPVGTGDDGAGLYIQSGCSGGTVTNCRFMGNSCEDQGGAVYNGGTSTTFESCTFSGNASDGNGAALAGNKAATLVDCTFQSNEALGHGGALYLTGSTHLIRRCTFQGNSCELDGGAIAFTDGGKAAITNCLITGNSAYGGSSNSNGGAFAIGSGATITITNTTICSNNSEYPGGAFWVYGASNVYLRNTTVYNNARAGDTTHWSAFYWVYDSDSHIYWIYSKVDTDPQLGSVPAPSTAPTLAGDFIPSSVSSISVDSGSINYNIDYSGAISGTTGEEETDIRGYTRVIDGNYNGTVYIDVGCYELDEPAATTTLADLTLNPSTGGTSSSVDLDDCFGGSGLTYTASSSSSNLLTQIDGDNNLTVSLGSGLFGDSTFTVTVTATDNHGQSVQQTFTVTFELTRLYVSKTATGAGNGRSWTDAFTELRDAMDYASSGDEIWIAEGVYKPSASDSTVGFTLSTDLSIHGGFGGGEGSLDEADPSAHVTVISGDIDGDDTVDSDGVTLAYTDQGAGGGNTSAPLFTVNSSSTLSGLVICGGTAGGIRTNSGSTLTLTDCIVRGNKITGDGGALNCLGGNHTFTDCQFLQNHATAHAGGIRNGVTGGTMTLDRCVLSGNDSNSNGGAYAVKGGSGSRTIRMRDCLLSGNHASNDGGAIHSWVGGASFYLTNCTIAANKADGEGGSIYKLYGGTVAINNTIVWGNSSDPAIKTGTAATATWKSCLVEGCGGSSAWDSFEMDTDGGNNLDTDPLFSSLPDSSAAPTLAGDFSFDATSPAFDAGDDTLSTSTTDLVGNARINEAAIDMGAYENISLHRPTFGFDYDSITVNEDSGAYTQTAFAEEMSANDDGQTLTGFTVTTDNDSLFSVLPAIDLNGTLTFTPADDANGSATVTVVLHDDGASVNESLPLTFPITVNPVDDAPSFDLTTPVTILEDSGAQSIANVVTNFSANDDGQTLLGYTIIVTDPTVFSVQPAINHAGTLTFKPAANFSGSIGLGVRAIDSGATSNQTTKTLTIEVTQVNDPPTFTLAGDRTSSSANDTVTVADFLTNFSTVESGQSLASCSVTTDNDALFLTLPSLSFSGTSATLSYRIANQAVGQTTVTVSCTDDGGTANGGIDTTTKTFVITAELGAAERFWVNNSGDNLWGTATNWSAGMLPGTLDTATIGNYDLTLLNDGSTRTVSTLSVGDTGALGDLRLSNASSLTVTSRMVLGDGESDNLSLTGGSTLSTTGQLLIKPGTGYTPTLSLSGSSQWIHTYNGTIDTIGTGGGTLEWNVTDGADVLLTSSGAAGSIKVAATDATVNLTVSGTGSSFDPGAHQLLLGQGGNLALTVENGAIFGNTTSGGITFGKYGGGTVTADILSGATLRSGAAVWVTGGATLRVDDASVDLANLFLTSGSATMQNGATGTIGTLSFTNPNLFTLDGAGTDLTVSNSNQGLPDGGMITVQAGAALHYASTGNFNLYSSDGAGSFLVTGSGSSASFAGGMTNTGTDSSATFTVADGANASFAGAISLTGTHALDFSGTDTSVSVAGDLTLGGSNTLTIDSGATLKIGGVLYAIPSATVSLLGDATLDVLTINNDFTHSAGILHPGDAAAAAMIDGNYTQAAAATLRLGIGGTTPGTGYDTLTVDGTASLAGTLKVELLDSYEPSAGDRFTVLTSSSLTDNGLAFDLPALASGKSWETQVGSQTITLTVVAGDALAAFRSTYGLAEDGPDDDADWSQNGVANIFYYLFGLGDPNEETIDHSLLPTLTSTDGYVTFSYRCPFPFDPLFARPYTSTDLKNWERLDGLTGDEAPVDVTATMEADGYLRYSYTIPTTRQARYFTVRPQTSAVE